MQQAEFVIPKDRVDARDYIEWRLRSVPDAVKGAIKTTLQYLYLTDGPRNLPADRKRLAEPYLETAERMVVRWLHPRTNGQYRKTYGYPALRAARKARYRCERCGIADVRVLEFDHVDGSRAADRRFAVLCANCHRIKSRAADWTGHSRRT
jgi:hypothetical protein